MSRGMTPSNIFAAIGVLLFILSLVIANSAMIVAGGVALGVAIIVR